MIKRNDFCEFARVELLKERCLGAKQKEQCVDMNMSLYSLRDFMRGYYVNHPVVKIIQYLIEKGGVILCPKPSVPFSNGSKQ